MDDTTVNDLMTAEEVAHYLRLDTFNVKDPVATVHRYRRQGKLRAVRLGRGHLFPIENVREFVQKRSDTQDVYNN